MHLLHSTSLRTALVAALALSAAHAQTTTSRPAPGEHTTIRHHKVAEAPNPADALTDQAEAVLDRKPTPDYAAAEPLLKQAVTFDAQYFRAWYDLGFLYDSTDRSGEAIAAYRKSVALKPDVFEAQLHLGLALAAHHDLDAEKFLAAATHLKPESKPEQNIARAWIALGRAQESHDPAAALASYDKAADVDPRQIASRLLAAQLLEKQDDIAGAEKRYQSALALTAKSAPESSESADALVGLANLYMRSKRLAEADTVLRQYLAGHPEQAAAHIQLARIFAAQADSIAIPQPAPSNPSLLSAPVAKDSPESKRKQALNNQAISEYETGIKLDGGDSTSILELGSIYIAAGKFTEAETLYRQQLLVSPRDSDLHHLLGVVLLKQKRFGDAQAELLTAVNLNPKSGAAYGDLASAAAENMQYELALKAMDERAKYLPEIPIGFFLRASCLDHLHLRKEADAAYHRFLETAKGQYPDQEWAARHRIIALEPKK